MLWHIPSGKIGEASSSRLLPFNYPQNNNLRISFEIKSAIGSIAIQLFLACRLVQYIPPSFDSLYCLLASFFHCWFFYGSTLQKAINKPYFKIIFLREPALLLIFCRDKNKKLHPHPCGMSLSQEHLIDLSSCMYTGANGVPSGRKIDSSVNIVFGTRLLIPVLHQLLFSQLTGGLPLHMHECVYLMDLEKMSV